MYNSRHHISLPAPLLVDEKSEACSTPPGFKGELLNRQKLVLHAMLKLEEYDELKIQEHVLHNNVGCIRENFGSGKSILILALILSRKVVSSRPVYNIGPVSGLDSDISTYSVKMTFRSDLILTPTLVIVPSSVVLQWAESVKKFTNLKVFVIYNINTLKLFYINLQNRSINTYDIVVVKNGNVSGELKLDGYVERVNDIRTRRIYNLIANMSRGLCWSRVVYDDYDICKLPTNAGLICGYFNWFVSATRSKPSSVKSRYIEHTSVNNILKYGCLDLSTVVSSGVFNTYLTIMSNPSMKDSDIKIGTPKFWIHNAVNPNKLHMNLIRQGLENDEKAIAIMNALNGDAFKEAAALAGITSDNIVDIVEKISRDNKDNYIEATVIINWLNNIDMKTIQNMGPPAEGESYHKNDLIKMVEITRNYPALDRKIEEVLAEYTEIKKKAGKALERVKENIQEGECPICCTSLSEPNEDTEGGVFILKCCGRILCPQCVKASLKRNGKSISCRCPYCRSTIGIQDLVHIGDDFDLKKIVDENYTTNEIEVMEKKIKDSENKELYYKKNILHSIVTGESRTGNSINMNINGMLRDDIVLPKPTIKKVLVYACYEETLIHTYNALNEYNIDCLILRGTTLQINTAAVRFQTDDNTKVLLINGAKFASGVNLQAATDLVFMHVMEDRDIVRQIIGRVQRIGRQYEVNIHFVLYEGENLSRIL